MRIRFRATDAGFDVDEYSIICGFNGRDDAGAEHAFSFDRLSEEAAAKDPNDDWGVHTQFDDQANGGYGCVGQCRLTRTVLSVDLSKQLGRLVDVDGFDIELSIADENCEQVRAGLARVFRGMLEILVIT